jgi:hypothetical protein
MGGALQSQRRAKALWLTAFLIGCAGFAGGLFWVSSSRGPGFDWIWAVAAFGLGAILYNIAFFALCSIFAPGLAGLVRDRTKIEGDTVHHVVEHADTGDEAVDFYIRAYASARAITAVAIVSGVMMGLALAFF